MQVSCFTFAPDLANVRNEFSVKDISCFLVIKLGPCLSGTPWTIADQTPLSMWFPSLKYWSSFLLQGISLERDQTCVSWIGRRILYHWATLELMSKEKYLEIYKPVFVSLGQAMEGITVFKEIIQH